MPKEDQDEAFLDRIAKEAPELLELAADEDAFQEALSRIIHTPRPKPPRPHTYRPPIRAVRKNLYRQ